MPAIASTLPRTREGGAKAISEMERLESKFDRSDQAFKTQVKPPWKLKLHTTRTTKELSSINHLQNRKSPAGLLHRNHKANTCKEK